MAAGLPLLKKQLGVIRQLRNSFFTYHCHHFVGANNNHGILNLADFINTQALFAAVPHISPLFSKL